MDNKEAIKAIKSNYPTENYTMLREALDLAIKALEEDDNEFMICPNCGMVKAES